MSRRLSGHFELGRRSRCHRGLLPDNLKNEILQTFTDGFQQRPHTTFGTMKADILEYFMPRFDRKNLVEVIKNSPWPELTDISAVQATRDWPLSQNYQRRRGCTAGFGQRTR